MSVRYIATASTTRWGTCVPPGPSRKATGRPPWRRRSAGNWARSASTSNPGMPSVCRDMDADVLEDALGATGHELRHAVAGLDGDRRRATDLRQGRTVGGQVVQDHMLGVPVELGGHHPVVS